MRLAMVFFVALMASAAPQRGLLICVSDAAPEAVRAAASATLQAVGTQPLLAVFSKQVAPSALCSSEKLSAGPAEERAYNHLVLVGLPSDPMIAKATQYEAKPEAGGFYIFGFGHLAGDIGYVESDRNPFLHGAAIPKAPFETEVVTLTGSTPQGVRLAVDAFLKEGLVNGVVAASGWKHPVPNLLDRDPLAPGFALPAQFTPQLDGYQLIGVTQGGEDEYRGVLADAGVAPRAIWRAKYYRDGVWDGEGEVHAFDEYSYGLHRRAFGNTLWVAKFASAIQAVAAAPKIAAAAKLHRAGDKWVGQQPAYAGGKYAGETDSAGPLSVWVKGDSVVMSTLPVAEVKR